MHTPYNPAGTEISVIVPHYQCEAFLYESILSLVKQSHRNIKVFVVDDHSAGDGWRLALAPFKGSDKIRLFRSSANVGPFRLYNAVLPMVKSPYIGLQDADDVSDPRRFELQLGYIQSSHADMVGTWFNYVTEEGALLERKKMPRFVNLYMRLGKGFVLLPASTLARREVFEMVSGYDGTVRYGADTDFIYRASHLFNISNCPGYLYNYRQRKGSLTAQSAAGSSFTARQSYSQLIQAEFRSRHKLPNRSDLYRAVRARPNNADFTLTEVGFA